jgi:hypothetical protein
MTSSCPGQPSTTGNKQELEEKMAASMPVLRKSGEYLRFTCLEGEQIIECLGFFGLFTPDEWANGGSPRRNFMGEVAKREGV